MAQHVVAPPDPPFPGPFLDLDDMPENTLHDQVISLLAQILSWWAKRLDLDALVARNLACRWDRSDARIGIDPDLLLTIPHPPLLDGRRSLKQLRLWEEGHHPPRLTLEVVSESTADKDYDEAPWAHAKAGTRELWIFDPELHGPTRGGGPFLLQVWQQQPDGALKRTHAGNGPAWSEEMQAWLVLTESATKLRLSNDRWGKHLWPTEAEARAKELEAKAHEAAEAKEREAKEAKAREAAEQALREQQQAREIAEAALREQAHAKETAETALREQTQAREATEIRAREQALAREAAEAEVRALRLRLAELEALRKNQGEHLQKSRHRALAGAEAPRCAGAHGARRRRCCATGAARGSTGWTLEHPTEQSRGPAPSGCPRATRSVQGLRATEAVVVVARRRRVVVAVGRAKVRRAVVEVAAAKHAVACPDRLRRAARPGSRPAPRSTLVLPHPRPRDTSTVHVLGFRPRPTSSSHVLVPRPRPRRRARGRGRPPSSGPLRKITYSKDEPGWFSPERIAAMAHLAARGKRGAVDVAHFLLDPHRHIHPLREEFLARTYQPSTPRGFLLHEPKPRLISALPFRDRVVQHLLIGACLPAFERWYAPQSYACRVGKGTHRALEAAARWFRSFPWVLRLDLAKFFPSIDHEILRGQIDPRTPPELRWLAHRILATPGVVEPVAFHFPGDDLFAPHQRPHGLPIGNLTSQIWANAMLTPVDHLIASRLGLGTFVRYCDDLLIFAHDPGRLRDAWRQIEERCWSLRLRLHPIKCRLHRTSEPVSFLGFVLQRKRDAVSIRLRSENARRFRRRLRHHIGLFYAGALEADEVLNRVRSWLSHARHGHTRALCKTELERISLSRPGGLPLPSWPRWQRPRPARYPRENRPPRRPPAVGRETTRQRKRSLPRPPRSWIFSHSTPPTRPPSICLLRSSSRTPGRFRDC